MAQEFLWGCDCMGDRSPVPVRLQGSGSGITRCCVHLLHAVTAVLSIRCTGVESLHACWGWMHPFSVGL